MKRKIQSFVRQGTELIALDTEGQLWSGSVTHTDPKTGQYDAHVQRWLWEPIDGPVVAQEEPSQPAGTQ